MRTAVGLKNAKGIALVAEEDLAEIGDFMWMGHAISIRYDQANESLEEYHIVQVDLNLIIHFLS
jgi:hypothetical protein